MSQSSNEATRFNLARRGQGDGTAGQGVGPRLGLDCSGFRGSPPHGIPAGDRLWAREPTTRPEKDTAAGSLATKRGRQKAITGVALLELCFSTSITIPERFRWRRNFLDLSAGRCYNR